MKLDQDVTQCTSNPAKIWTIHLILKFYHDKKRGFDCLVNHSIRQAIRLCVWFLNMLKNVFYLEIPKETPR